MGGGSRRMGRDKARLELAGQTLATRLADLLASLVEEVLLVGGEPPPGTVGQRVPDPSGPACALRGVVGALEAATRESVLVLATDLHLLTPDPLPALVTAPRAPAAVRR
ncbi:MAG: NTP transferase domain-containing protein, partial [Myxococcota bacterium]